MPLAKRLFLLFLLASLNAQAQRTPFFVIPEGEPNHTFYGGFAIGLNASQVDGDGYSGYHKAGLNVGPMVYARFNRTLSMSMELLYTQKGSKSRMFLENNYGVPYQDAYDIKLNYAEVPVLLHLFFHGRIHYGLGISYAYLINSKEEAYTVQPVNIHPEINYFKKDDLSGLGEISYELFPGFFANLRFNYSLRTIRDPMRIPQGYGNGTFGQQLNNVWSIRFVYLHKSKPANN